MVECGDGVDSGNVPGQRGHDCGGMLVYKEETSTVVMMVSGGREMVRDWIMSKKWFVSWTLERRDLAKCWRWASM